MDPCFDQSFGHGYWSISPTDCHLFAQDSPELGRRWADAGHPARWMKNESAVTTSQQSTLPASPFHQRSILAGTNKQTSNHIGLSKDWRLRTSCYGEGLGLCHASPPALSRSRLRSAFCRSDPSIEAHMRLFRAFHAEIPVCSRVPGQESGKRERERGEPKVFLTPRFHDRYIYNPNMHSKTAVTGHKGMAGMPQVSHQTNPLSYA